MLNLSLTLNGRKIRPDQLAHELQKAMYRDVSENVRRRLAALRCPEHGSSPRVMTRGQSLDRLSFELAGCCQKLIDKASRVLR